MKGKIVFGILLLALNINAQFSTFKNSKESRDSNEVQQGTEYAESKFLLDVNKFKLPINNRGVLGNVKIELPDSGFIEAGEYDSKVVLFTSGFGLSGFDGDGKLWSNGVNTASRIQDYVPGNFNGTPNSNTVIFVLKKDAAPFSLSWEEWKKAVNMGAYFYDGNNNGKYDPIDLNNNGLWDNNEDKPDILGDITSWTIYNDGVPSNERLFNKVNPQGIEIRQTVWGYSATEDLNSTIFVRYSIFNTGIYAENHDNVIFCLWVDPEIGIKDHANLDDLCGSDTLLNSGFAYNNGHDNDFGKNPPCLLTKILQGPMIKSFNSQNIAVNNKGFLGIDSIQGYENLGLTSFISQLESFGFDDAADEMQLRNFLLGKNHMGGYLDPCNNIFGKVVNLDCNQIDPKFHFSGEPNISYGWLNSWPMDVHYYVSTGPFKLEVGKPIDIIAAYIVARDTSALSSISLAKQMAGRVQQFYESNFTEYPPVSVTEKKYTQKPHQFALLQNYPNPFNPTTTINYEIPQSGYVKLIIYNSLGEEVKTLVNQRSEKGNYKIDFNASNLSSGIYYYELKLGAFREVKKMLLLK